MIYTMSQPYFPPSTDLFETIKDKFFETVKEELACYLPDLDVSSVYSRTYGNIKRTPIMIKIEVRIPDGCADTVEDQLEEVIDNVINDAYAIEAEKHEVYVQNQITGISRQEEINEIVEMSREHFIEKLIDEVTSKRQKVAACEIEEAEELEELDYQKAVIGKQVKSGKYEKMKKRLIGQGGTENTEPFVKKPSYERSKQAPAGFSALEESDR